jgi:hypothetical protein
MWPRTTRLCERSVAGSNPQLPSFKTPGLPRRLTTARNDECCLALIFTSTAKQSECGLLRRKDHAPRKEVLLFCPRHIKAKFSYGEKFFALHLPKLFGVASRYVENKSQRPRWHNFLNYHGERSSKQGDPSKALALEYK